VIRRQVVDEALATLRPEARAALVLRHYYGYEYSQIATYLGTTSGTVGSMLSRAHAALRTRLEGEPAATDPRTTEPGSRAAANHVPEPPEVLP
jgi:DNA-directed RNA polymerase specialized sigma24 family protein